MAWGFWSIGPLLLTALKGTGPKPPASMCVFQSLEKERRERRERRESGGPTETSVLLKGYVVVYDNCLHVGGGGGGGGGQRIEL